MRLLRSFRFVQQAAERNIELEVGEMAEALHAQTSRRITPLPRNEFSVLIHARTSSGGVGCNAAGMIHCERVAKEAQ